MQVGDVNTDVCETVIYYDSASSSERFQPMISFTCDPADLVIGEVSRHSSHMRPQTVTQHVNPVPGQLQLVLTDDRQVR